jgi:hypothetical protein
MLRKEIGREELPMSNNDDGLPVTSVGRGRWKGTNALSATAKAFHSPAITVGCVIVSAEIIPLAKPQSHPAGQLPARLVEIQLTGGPQTATLRPVQRMVMSDTPLQRKPPSKIDCALAAHERRARLIAQLHKQAVATASDLAAKQKASTTGIIKDGWRQKAEPWLCMSAFLLALGGIVAVGCILIRAVPWK